MKPWAALTARGQLRRLRPLAVRALAAWPIGGRVGRVLGHGENTVYEIRGRLDGEPSPGRFALRLHRPDYHSDDALRSELRWLDALHRETDVGASEPIQTRAGGWFAPNDAPGVPGGRRATLLRWIPGRFVRQARPAHARAIGDLLARLHAHAAGWRPDPPLIRPRWDADGFLGPSPNLGSPLDCPGLSVAERDRLTRACGSLYAALGALDRGPERFGLIHADLHARNVLLSAGPGRRPRARPIDFDDCGFGWFVFDLVVSERAMGWVSQDPAPLRAALRAGYTARRPLSADERAALPALRAVNRLLDLAWVVSRADNPRVAAHLPAIRTQALAACDRWLDGGDAGG